MKFLGLDNKEYKVNLAKYRKYSNNPSNLHLQARLILEQVYPAYQILEEVRLKGTKCESKQDLFADFFIIEIRTIFEIQGRQHFEYIPHFHSSKRDFFLQRRRDKIKEEWCKINNIELIKLRYDNINEWKRIISDD